MGSGRFEPILVVKVWEMQAHADMEGVQGFRAFDQFLTFPLPLPSQVAETFTFSLNEQGEAVAPQVWLPWIG